jgi:hypothetical protein
MLEVGSISIVVFLLKMFSMNLSTGNYETYEEYRPVNKTTDLSSLVRVTINDVTTKERRHFG